MIVDDITVFDGKQIQERFAFDMFGYGRTLAIGNIISFIGGLNYRENDNFLCAEQCVNFCMELPKYDTTSGVLFNRLFLTNVAQILNETLDKPIDVSQNKLIVKAEHENRGIVQNDGIVSVNFMSQVNDAFLIYIGLYNKTGDESEARAFSMDLDTEECTKLMELVHGSFYFLANDIFLNTCHVK